MINYYILFNDYGLIIKASKYDYEIWDYLAEYYPLEAPYIVREYYIS